MGAYTKEEKKLIKIYSEDQYELKKSMGAALRQRRLNLQLSIDEVAEKSNLSTAFIGLIERGGRGCKIVNYLTLYDLLNCRMEDIMFHNASAKRLYCNNSSDNEIELSVFDIEYEKTENMKRMVDTLIADYKVEELELVAGMLRSINDFRRTYDLNHIPLKQQVL